MDLIEQKNEKTIELIDRAWSAERGGGGRRLTLNIESDGIVYTLLEDMILGCRERERIRNTKIRWNVKQINQRRGPRPTMAVPLAGGAPAPAAAPFLTLAGDHRFIIATAHIQPQNVAGDLAPVEAIDDAILVPVEHHAVAPPGHHRLRIRAGRLAHQVELRVGTWLLRRQLDCDLAGRDCACRGERKSRKTRKL